MVGLLQPGEGLVAVLPPSLLTVGSGAEDLTRQEGALPAGGITRACEDPTGVRSSGTPPPEWRDGAVENQSQHHPRRQQREQHAPADPLSQRHGSNRSSQPC